MTLKEFRIKHCFTKVRIAQACGVSLTMVNNWEAETSKPTGERKNRLMQLYSENKEAY